MRKRNTGSTAAKQRHSINERIEPVVSVAREFCSWLIARGATPCPAQAKRKGESFEARSHGEFSRPLMATRSSRISRTLHHPSGQVVEACSFSSIVRQDFALPFMPSLSSTPSIHLSIPSSPMKLRTTVLRSFVCFFSPSAGATSCAARLSPPRIGKRVYRETRYASRVPRLSRWG